MADLLTVYLGLGVIVANAAFEFNHATDPHSPRTSRWSASRLGYLTEPARMSSRSRRSDGNRAVAGGVFGI